jgi:hypothetical protein
MRQVDPGFPLPQITFNELRYLHADGRPDVCFAAGESIAVRVFATNHGDGVDARLVLDLADSPGQSSPYHHAVVEASLPAGETRMFTVDVPGSPDRAAGLHQASLSFEDVHAVLGFARRGWEPAFWAGQPCPQLAHTRYLPLVQR